MPGPTMLYEFREGMFVTEAGEILSQRPVTHVAGGGQSLAPALRPLGGGDGADGVITGDPRYKTVILAAEIAKKTSELVKEASKIVSSMVTIVGILDAMVQIAELAGAFGTKDKLDGLIKLVVENLVATIEASKISHLQNMALPMGHITGGKTVLETYKATPSPNNRQDLLDANGPVRDALQALLNPSFQQVLFVWAEYQPHSWSRDFTHITLSQPNSWIAGQGAARYPGISMIPVPVMTENASFAARFDYRFALGNIVLAVLTRTVMMKAIEPEFRSTGRFRNELKNEIVPKLRALQYQWILAIQVSAHPYDAPADGLDVNDIPTSKYYEDNFGYWYIPVGAIDTVSGYAQWERIEVNDPFLGPQAFPRFILKSRTATWAEASTKRAAAREHVMQASGYMDFAAFVAMVEELTTDPSESETVVIKEIFRPDRVVAGERWIKKSDFPKTAGGLICSEREFQGSVWELRRADEIFLSIRTQTPESIDTFAIDYEFVLTTAEGDKVLQEGRHAIDVKPQHFVVERGPVGERREVKQPSAQVSITCTLERAPGETRLRLELAPGHNVRFQIRVREKIQSGTELMTSHEVELVTVEERLPSEYFRHLAACQTEQASVFNELNERFAISESARLPRFDPRKGGPAEYLEYLQQRHPEGLQHAVNAIRLNR